ncbi:MAG: FtsB family cell division protein [Candidatus Rokuibacteriota bacterium]
MSRRRLIVLAAAAVAVLALASGTVSGMLGFRAIQREIAAAERDIATLRAQAETLTRMIDRLRHDPAYVEKLAREEHGLVREGESVLKFPPKPK